MYCTYGCVATAHVPCALVLRDKLPDVQRVNYTRIRLYV